MTAGLVLALLPVAIRNYAVAGDWSPASSHGGLNFYIGNNANADGTYRPVPGITPDMQIQAVNEQAFNAANLRQTIVEAEKTNAPIKLLLKRDDQYLTVTLDYHGGLRYPRLERVESAPNLLDRVLAPAK